ncbi:RWD domain-containing protein 3 [Anabas testudineus]|uniref:RWD domain-containing protein 3 n=1 Tax=Anabas testudineus TaxID=64144 RepID=A0A7N6BUF7_ANATE|nr:RWD domain-containing protein 3 [Anabas testudineus]
MSEAALDEVSVLSSIYCGAGEFQLLQQSAEDGVLLQINICVERERRLDVSLSFHLHPHYPSRPPDISVSSTGLSRSRCHNIRQKLLEQAATLPPEPMVHQLVEFLQECVELTEDCKGDQDGVEQTVGQEQWISVLLLDHIRSRNCYIGLLECWTQQLQLTGMLLLGRSILVILQGAKPDIKKFCRLLKTVKVDVDSSGKKCKERMMKVLIETPLSSSCGYGLKGFVVKNYQSLSELTASFQELHLTELYQQMLPSLRDWQHAGSHGD